MSLAEISSLVGPSPARHFEYYTLPREWRDKSEMPQMTTVPQFWDKDITSFIQYIGRNKPWYSLRGLHIRVTWFSLYGIRIPLFSLYGIHMPLFPNIVLQPIVLGMALLWAVMDSVLSQGPLLWCYNDITVIVLRNTRGRERDTRQCLHNTNARRLQTFNW